MSEKAPTVDHLLATLAWESRREAFQFLQLRRKSVEERVEALRCIPSAVVSAIFPDQIEVTCAVNHARFRHGDKVRVSGTGRPETVSSFEMEWVEDDGTGTRIVLQKTYLSRRQEIPFRPGDRVDIDSAEEDSATAVARHLRRYALSPSPRFRGEDFLSGHLAAQAAPWDGEVGDQVARALRLNPGQREALQKSVTCFPLAGVQGPAGTGKTTVLVAVALYYLQKGRRVLITAISHFAINHALNRLRTALGETGDLPLTAEIIKISRNKNRGLIPGVLQASKISAVPSSNLPRAVGMTIHKLPLEVSPGFFDVLLLDEASQASLPLAFLAMIFARKTIFFGDHRQLGPVGQEDAGSGTESAFAFVSRAYGDRIAFLGETFRMTPSLVEWSSRVFYEGRVFSQKIKSPSTRSPLAGHPVLDPNVENCLVPLSHACCGKYSAEEASLIAVWIRRWVAEGSEDPAAIAVVVPFRSQANLIRLALRHLEKQNGRKGWFDPVVIDTVERMQGQEREIVIVSLTASDPDFLGKSAAHFFQGGRLNVSLTRAARKRVVVGSPHLLLARFEALDELADVARFAHFFQEEPRALPPADDLREAAQLVLAWGPL